MNDLSSNPVADAEMKLRRRGIRSNTKLNCEGLSGAIGLVRKRPLCLVSLKWEEGTDGNIGFSSLIRPVDDSAEGSAQIEIMKFIDAHERERFVRHRSVILNTFDISDGDVIQRRSRDGPIRSPYGENAQDSQRCNAGGIQPDCSSPCKTDVPP
jgi:hypothetical protein